MDRKRGKRDSIHTYLKYMKMINKDRFSKLNKMQRMHLNFILKVHREHMNVIFIRLAVFALNK